MITLQTAIHRIINKPYIACMALLTLLLLSNASNSAVYSGIDTLSLSGGFDFSNPESFFLGRIEGDKDDDILFFQSQNSHTLDWSPGLFKAANGIRNLGNIPFDSLVEIPSHVVPDSSAAFFSLGHFPHQLPIIEDNVYIIWTVENHFAKVRIREIISYTDTNADAYPEIQYGNFIVYVLIEWTYQDNGSRSFLPETIIAPSNWGNVKRWK